VIRNVTILKVWLLIVSAMTVFCLALIGAVTVVQRYGYLLCR